MSSNENLKLHLLASAHSLLRENLPLYADDDFTLLHVEHALSHLLECYFEIHGPGSGRSVDELNAALLEERSSRRQPPPI
jgi:hypothetical protein